MTVSVRHAPYSSRRLPVFVSWTAPRGVTHWPSGERYPCPWKYRFRKKIMARVVLTVLKVNRHIYVFLLPLLSDIYIYIYNIAGILSYRYIDTHNTYIITRICDILSRSTCVRVLHIIILS